MTHWESRKLKCGDCSLFYFRFRAEFIVIAVCTCTMLKIDRGNLKKKIVCSLVLWFLKYKRGKKCEIEFWFSKYYFKKNLTSIENYKLIIRLINIWSLYSNSFLNQRKRTKSICQKLVLCKHSYYPRFKILTWSDEMYISVIQSYYGE